MRYQLMRATRALVLLVTACGDDPDPSEGAPESNRYCPTTAAYDLAKPQPQVLADALRTYVPSPEEARIAAAYWSFVALAVQRGQVDEGLAQTDFVARLSAIADRYPALFVRDCAATVSTGLSTPAGARPPPRGVAKAACGQPCPVQADVAAGLSPELAAGVEALSRVSRASDLEAMVKDVARLLRGDCGGVHVPCPVSTPTGPMAPSAANDAFVSAILQTVGEAILGSENLNVVHDLLGFGQVPPTRIVEAEGTLAALLAQAALAPVVDDALTEARACADARRSACKGDNFVMIAAEGGECANLLAAFRPWTCPANPDDPDETLQPPRTSAMVCQRDILVDEAVQSCWLAECRARQGDVCAMREALEGAADRLCEALKLCSKAPGLAPAGTSCDTIREFPCPP
jgi:hypothetical protein